MVTNLAGTCWSTVSLKQDDIQTTALEGSSMEAAG
jgi:hypothetical protein